MKTIQSAPIAIILFISMLPAFAQTTYGQSPADERLAKLREMQALNDGAYESQCTVYDDEQWYTAFNEKLGDEGDPQLANSLLRSCQEQLKDKLAGKVQAITTTYFDQMDTENGSYEREHIEGASQMAVEQFINETQEYCRKKTVSSTNDNKILLFMAIRVKKTDLLQVMENGIESDSEAKVRFNEQKFREAAFKVFENDTKSQTQQ